MFFCHTYHSLRYGTISVEELVTQAVALGLKELCLTDINTVTAIYDFTRLCKANNIKPIVGMEIRENGRLLYTVLAKNPKGIASVNRMITRHNLDKIPLAKIHPDLEDVFVIYPLGNIPENLSENERIGIRPEQTTLLVRPELKRLIPQMIIFQPVTINTFNSTQTLRPDSYLAISTDYDNPGLYALGNNKDDRQSIHLGSAPNKPQFKAQEEDYFLHKILRAIDLNTLISKLSKDQICQKNEYLKPKETLLSHFQHFLQIIKNSETLLDQCHFDFEFGVPRNKKHFLNSKEEDVKLLTRLAYEGMEQKYGLHDEEAKKRVAKELKVIEQLNFCSYFLVTWDIIQYSKSQGLMHIGRGSGANSVIAYCLGITNVCPIELDLYFERFLNLNRKSPPDFDVDWSWQDRDTILHYIFRKYGRNHVAFCGTNVEFKYRSIYREIGKVFGLPKEEIDVLASKYIPVKDDNRVTRLAQKYGQMLERFPNQRSMHSCGVLISEEPITNYSALEILPKGFPLVQFDMNVAEDIGLEKFDILSQRGIGHIKDAKKLIQKNQGITVDIEDDRLSKDEKHCNELLAQGKTIGCFYIESPAMRGLLRRLKCDNYKTLVAASSIIRPGVAKSGMMREYVFRHNHPDQFEYFHPIFKQYLSETYGIMVYQEDVIKIAIHYGGLSAADGDVLRRAMSGKHRSIEALERVKTDFFESCKKQGHDERLSAEVYRQIESFAGYSFCKAHSASYAVESYQSLYLKAYFPLEFMVAVINNQGGFYRTEVYVHEARMAGARILNPCVNHSSYETSIIGKDIYLGFMHLQSLDSKVAFDLAEEREKNGRYTSLENFVRRVSIGLSNLKILIFIGAFRFTGRLKSELLIQAQMLCNDFKPEQRFKALFNEPVREYRLPDLPRDRFEDAFDEIELLSFPVSCSPFDLLKTKYRGSVMAKDLDQYHKKEVKMVGYLISRKHVPTKRGTMYFGTWIDFDGNYFDTTHFPDNLQKYPFQGGGCYLLLGTVEVDFHFPTIIISKMAKLPFIPDPRYAFEEDKRYEVYEKIREDVSMTWRKPYPQEKEIGLPRRATKQITQSENED